MQTIKKVWIVGASGQIGTALQDMAPQGEYELVTTSKQEVNVKNLEAVLAFMDKERPEVVMNCAGITDTQICTINPEEAYAVNALGARNLAIGAKETGSLLVQFSTDDVFDGLATSPYHEFEDTHPTTVYGRSKRAGERYVKEFTTEHFIIRSSWIYGRGGVDNYVHRLLKRTLIENEISVASDQYGSPTSANALAGLVWRLIKTKRYGLYHGTCEGVCSRYEFAKEILRLAGKKTKLIPVATPDAEITSTRPKYTVLDNFMLRLQEEEGLQPWAEALEEYMVSGEWKNVLKRF